jgi:hypothetical protein
LVSPKLPRNGLRPPTVLLDFSFIKFIEIGFTFSIAFLSSRIIGINLKSRGRQAMGGRSQDSPGGSRSASSQGSPAMLREIYEQPQALCETIRRKVERNNVFATAAQSIDSVFFGDQKNHHCGERLAWDSQAAKSLASFRMLRRFYISAAGYITQLPARVP